MMTKKKTNTRVRRQLPPYSNYFDLPPLEAKVVRRLVRRDRGKAVRSVMFSRDGTRRMK
jgi:hypothetical protein